METLTGLMIGGLIYYSGSLIIKGELELNNFFSFLAAMMLAYQPVRTLATLNMGIHQGLSAAKRLLPIIDEDNSEILSPKLSSYEYSYRENIQINLKNYLDIWSLIDQTWQLKPLKFEYMNEWKSNQEKSMDLQRGSSLKDKNLSNFLRMLNVSIPHKSFDDINSDVLLMINQDRKLIRVGLN